KIQVVSHGMEIMVDKYMVPGKTTIFDFYSDFCPPCVRIAPYLEELVNQRDDLYLVKVDINRASVTGGIDWGSPVVMQFTLRSIPHFKIYGPNGKIQAEGDAAFRQVIQWIEDVRKSEGGEQQGGQ
ncbi:MAG: thioredoxin family protein, partial [Armatimonadetes bacterium]|nr:thioredoxin family protein [Armatimonadota bacterium]